MGTHLRACCEGYPMSTNMTGFRWFSRVNCKSTDIWSINKLSAGHAFTPDANGLMNKDGLI